MAAIEGTRGYSPIEPLKQTVTTPAAAASTPARTPASSTGGADQALLSGAATLFAQTAGTGDVRLDKVAALRQAIASGSYNVPSSAVADKLIDTLTR